MENEKNGMSPYNIVGQSELIKKVFTLIEKIADTDSTVLVTGESGTGKELVAKAIHLNSLRRENRLISINCGAIPEGLMESELFGHEKGAFTGSVRTRVGKFEAADKGTIFLDEIGEMSYQFQVKLLRVLQEKEIERVGGNESIPVDVRVIAATNKDLEKEIQEKNFREDLFYRLNVIPVTIPPLRERRDDIPVLIDYFLSIYTRHRMKPVCNLKREAKELMYCYDWPGNVRELENIVERIVILKGEGDVTAEDLPEKIKRVKKGGILSPIDNMKGERDVLPVFDSVLNEEALLPEIDLPPVGTTLRDMVEELEKQLIIKALHKSGGVKNSAAKLLGVNRTTLVEKIKKIGITPTGEEK